MTVDGQTVNRMGAINQNGDVIIQPIYDWVDRFSEGVAAVQRDHRVFYVNTRGQEVFELPDTCTSAGRFMEGVADVAIGGTNPRPEFMTPPDARWG